MTRFERWAGALAAALLALAASAGAGAQTVQGTVKDGSKQAVAGATVYLVPAADVEKLAKAPSIRDPGATSTTTSRWRTTSPPTATSTGKAMTDPKGAFSIAKVADGKYFVYVEPTDRDHLPGGDLCQQVDDRGRTRREAAGDPGLRQDPGQRHLRRQLQVPRPATATTPT